MSKYPSIIAKILLTVVFIFSLSGLATAEGQPEIKKVDTAQVCMINNTVMGKPQIPVEVEGKTYYGCCQGCVAKLKQSKSARMAVDPVSKREVDKAKAFITAAPDGTALYFESEETASLYHASLETEKK